MYHRSTLILAFRVLCGLFSCGMILIGLFASLVGGFNLAQLSAGFLLTFLVGSVAFRQRAYIGFSVGFWLSALVIAYLSAPWLPLVTTIDNLKPGTPRAEVVARLKPWVHESYIPQGDESSSWAPLHLRVQKECRTLLSPPEAVTLSFQKNRLKEISLIWD